MSRNYEISSDDFRDNVRDGQSASPSPLFAAGIAAGSALCLYAFTHGKKTGAALVAVSVIALTQGRTASTYKAYEASASFEINCSPETAYHFWKDLENLPRFMQYLESVKKTGEGRSEWTAVGPLNSKLHWTAETTEDRENERIAWRSVEWSQVETSGSVEFLPAPGGRGTLAKATIQYAPPAGLLGKAFATIMGKDPQFLVREDLRRFKALLEAGEIPTTVGQTHGPRGLMGHAQEVLLREKQNMSAPQSPQPQRAREDQLSMDVAG